MARKEVIQYFDDLDNSPLSQDQVETVQFRLDNQEYELDLSAENARKFREVLSPYLDNARKVNATRRRRRASSNNGGAAAYGIDPSEVRAWAEANGIQVNKRGKIKTETVERYREAKGLA
ncbi:Lsr2 family protein [Corynebacterium poyangense]|uniref:Lsr2 family protein n=1 Tax=Corynebacterium poyangense TaxID=2684405 RepID=A0A7H0SRT6_9CORY|nr:Lsr2 family protein [Corynebacterium poyangense]MBZ8176695.1 Lsr2 family protein [Corynebacterium poyangense]QNQ91261.1 Lsr2 family protein [Corynebacterium poyangense]